MKYPVTKIARFHSCRIAFEKPKWRSQYSDQAIGWMIRGLNSGRGKKFLCPLTPRPILEPTTVPHATGTRGSLPGRKRPGSEPGNSPKYIAVVNP